MNAIDARQKCESHLVSAAALHRGVQHLTRRFHFSTLERRHAVVKQFLGFALLFGHAASGAIDIRASARVIAIEEERPRPDVDSLCVISGEILIEAGNEQALDFGVALGVAVDRWRALGYWVRAERIGHARGQNYAAESAVIQERNAAD